MTQKSAQSNGRVSRRNLLKSLAVGTGGSIALSTLNPAVKGMPQQEMQSEESEEEAPPSFETLVTAPEINEEFEYTEQTEFATGSEVYLIANMANLIHDGVLRYAYDIYVLGGAGVMTHASEVVLSNVREESGDEWQFWYRVSTDERVGDYAPWVPGEYTAFVTVTDFISQTAITEQTVFYLE